MCSALTRLALNDPDPEWLEGIFMAHLSNPDPWVRGVSALCLGHVARLHGTIDTSKVVPALKRLLEDSETEEKARDALDDIETFI